MSKPNQRIVNVGLIGCGLVAQTVHIPTLNHMSSYYHITHLCDTSPSALSHCRSKISHASGSVKTTTSAAELCSDPDVAVVFVLSSDEYHVPHAVLALEAGKVVFIEKPMAMCERDVASLKEVRERTKGTVMVGYMRRFAPAFEETKDVVGGMGEVRYAVVRDIIGRNEFFADQSGTFVEAFDDYPDEARQERRRLAAELAEQGIKVDMGLEVTADRKTAWNLLGSLGSHDLSAMREVLGMPQAVLSSYINTRSKFWSATFQYEGFVVHYESGIHSVPIFDAFIEVFSDRKQVKIKYDTPFVKGLPITMTVREDVDGTGSLKETTVRKTYEDPYTVQMRELYALVTEGKPVKTTVEDAALDLRIFQMVLKAAGESLC